MNGKLKFYFWHIKSDEVGTTLKHPETINGNVENLSRRIENERQGESMLLMITKVRFFSIRVVFASI